MKTMEIGLFAPNPEEEEAAQEGEKAAAEPKAPASEPLRFVDMEPLIIPIFQGENVTTTIQITVKLEVIGTDNVLRIRKLLPRLNDAFLRDLYSYIPRLLRKTDRVNVMVVKKRLQRVSDKVAGPGTVDGILVQSVTDTSRLPKKKGGRRARPQPTAAQPAVLDPKAVNPAPEKGE